MRIAPEVRVVDEGGAARREFPTELIDIGLEDVALDVNNESRLIARSMLRSATASSERPSFTMNDTLVDDPNRSRHAATHRSETSTPMRDSQ